MKIKKKSLNPIKLLKKVRQKVYAEKAKIFGVDGYLITSEEFLIPKVNVHKLFVEKLENVIVILRKNKTFICKRDCAKKRKRKKRKSTRKIKLMNFKPLKLDKFTFSLCWGRIYKIKFFGYPEEEVMFLNRLDNSRILCCSENELNEKWTERSVIAKKVTCSSAEHAYIINESAFYCGQHNYVDGAELYENFEFVDQLISLKFLNLSEIDYRYQYLWHLNDSSPEMRALYWFSNKLLSVDDIKLLEKKHNHK